MPRSKPNDLLIFSGPEYADMVLDPSESFYENISLAHTLRLLERGESLWGKNHGSAQLHWCFKKPYGTGHVFQPNDRKPSLVILFNVDWGFHFRFDFRDMWHVAFDPHAPIERVVHELCGEPAYFPRSTFVPLKVAKGVVRKFVREQDKFSRLMWVDSNDYDFSDPDAWQAFDSLCR